MRLPKDSFDIATPNNCNVTQIEWERILKDRANRFDVYKDFKIQLTINDGDLAVGKMQHSSCTVANSCTREKFLFKHVTRDVAFIGVLYKGEPKIIRLRSGDLPRRFDRLHAMVVSGELPLEELGVKLARLRTSAYVLKAFSDSQTLDAKRGVKKTTAKTKKPQGKRFGNKDIHGYITRGTVVI